MCRALAGEWAGNDFQFIEYLREDRKLVAVDDLAKDLLPRCGIVHAMYVFVRVGVVIVVLEDKVRAGYPANVKKTIATNLEYSPAANVPVMKFVLNFQGHISAAVHPATQHQFIGIICGEVQCVPTGSVGEGVLF